MSVITADLVKQLRERTGVGLAKCKSALEETGGNVELAIEALRKAGIASAVKKESRETKEGRVEYFETPETLAVIEMNAETDFVVNNDRFKQLHRQLVELLAKAKSQTVAEFLEVQMPKDPSKTVDDLRKELISVLGENIVLSRISAIAKKPNHSLGIYSHMNGKIFVAVEIEGCSSVSDFARDIAMHAAAEAPDFLRMEDVPQELKDKEIEIATSQAPKDKPEKVVEMIIQGKLKGFYDQVCLLNQKYIKDNAITISELVAKKGKEIGKNLAIVKFIRFHAGN
jgi:elongation factor Ts